MFELNGFSVKGCLPSLNDYVNACRTHWAKGAALKQETETLIFWSIKSAQNKGCCHPVMQPVVVFFLWHEHGDRRDADNVYSAKKYILDAMQKAGVIKNDNRKYVVDCIDMGIVPAKKGQDGVEVLMMEVDSNEWDKCRRRDAYLRAHECFSGADASASADEEAGRRREQAGL